MPGSESNDHQALKARIEEWLDAEGISFSDVPDLNSFFHIKANLKNLPIEVSESKVRKGVIAVQGGLELSPDQLESYERTSVEDRKSLFNSLFVMLDKSEYLFLLQEDFTIPKWLKIERILYAEDLTRTGLLDQMKDLNTKFVNINYFVNDSLGSFKSASNKSMYD